MSQANVTDAPLPIAGLPDARAKLLLDEPGVVFTKFGLLVHVLPLLPHEKNVAPLSVVSHDPGGVSPQLSLGLPPKTELFEKLIPDCVPPPTKSPHASVLHVPPLLPGGQFDELPE